MIDELKWMINALQELYPEKRLSAERVSQRKWAVIERVGVFKVRAFNLPYASCQHDLAELIENFILKERSEKED